MCAWMKALEKKMAEELQEAGRRLTRLRIGITHTAESSIVAEVLARYTNENPGISITIVTDNINNLYDMLENFELDLAVVEGRSTRPELSALMLDTDYLVCVLANTHPLSHSSMITLDEIRQEKLILRLPNSETRVRFESALAAIGESIADFQVILEVDNVATIKDLIRKNLGISILARSACMDRAAQGQAHCPAHREPEHDPGDQPGLSPGILPTRRRCRIFWRCTKNSCGNMAGLDRAGRVWYSSTVSGMKFSRGKPEPPYDWLMTSVIRKVAGGISLFASKTPEGGNLLCSLPLH